ncbi:unnamed protein product [Gadus morhua 'NCC']
MKKTHTHTPEGRSAIVWRAGRRRAPHDVEDTPEKLNTADADKVISGCQVTPQIHSSVGCLEVVLFSKHRDHEECLLVPTGGSIAPPPLASGECAPCNSRGHRSGDLRPTRDREINEGTRGKREAPAGETQETRALSGPGPPGLPGASQSRTGPFEWEPGM